MKKFLICMMVMAVVFATACSKAEPTEQMDGVPEDTVQVETNTDNAPKVANTPSQTTKNTKVKRVKTEPIKDESAPEGATMPTKDGISGTAWQNEYESLVFDDKGAQVICKHGFSVSNNLRSSAQRYWGAENGRAHLGLALLSISPSPGESPGRGWTGGKQTVFH